MAGKSYYHLYTSIGKLWDFIGNCPLAMFDYRRIPFLTRLRRLRSFFLINYGTISQPSTGGERGPDGPIKIKNTHQLWCCLLHPFWWFLVVPPLVLVLYICYLLLVTMSHFHTSYKPCPKNQWLNHHVPSNWHVESPGFGQTQISSGWLLLSYPMQYRIVILYLPTHHHAWWSWQVSR